MRQLLRGTLAAVLVTVTLAGCGQAPRNGIAIGRVPAKLRGLNTQQTSHAQRFAEAVKAMFAGHVTIDGDRVTLRFEKSMETLYDFSDTAATGQVRVVADGFEAVVPFADLMEGFTPEGASAEVLPALLVPIAIQCAAAGAQALALYYFNHRGDDFVKEDALKAIVVGMGIALIPFCGQIRYINHLGPVAIKLLAASATFAAPDIARAAMSMLPNIVSAVRAILKERKQAAG